MKLIHIDSIIELVEGLHFKTSEQDDIKLALLQMLNEEKASGLVVVELEELNEND